MKKRRRVSVLEDPKSISRHLSQALTLHRAGKARLAERLLETVLDRHPNNADALNAYGCFLKECRRSSEAAGVLERAVQAAPSVAGLWVNLGAARQDNGDSEAALRAYRQAVELEPERWEVYPNLALLLRRLNDPAQAEKFYGHAIRLKPDCAPAWGGLASLYADLGRLDGAISCFNQAIRLEPTAERYCDLARVQIFLCLYDAALESARKAVAFNPRLAMAHCHIGDVLRRQGRIMEAKRALETAVAVDANCALGMEGIATTARLFCDWEEAISWHVRALEIKPDASDIHSSLMFTLSICGSVTPPRLLEEHVRWAQMHGPRAPAFQHGPCGADPARPLRVGFVSGDFWDHPVQFFIAPILEHLDRARFKVVCYSNSPYADFATLKLRSLADEWREVAARSDADLASQINEDHIDILVDLSGHTSRNRLLAFARKPAPVQVTYLGYLNTTGLKAMDYWLTDSVLHPADTEQTSTERIWRLPRCWVIYQPPPKAPEVTHRDAGEAVTFASFASLQKFSPESIRLWARVLAAAPESKLLIKTVGMGGEEERAKLMDRIALAGIPCERVTLMGHTPAREAHLALYGLVDVAFDTTPFSGATTTAEALWMGVPVVTLPGALMGSRMSASILHAVGLDEFIAQDEEDFVRIASELARNAGYRSQLRRELRARVAASPLCDGPDLAEKVGAAFRQMWMEWCTPKEQEIAV